MTPPYFTPEQENRLQMLTSFMLDYNQKVNLTAIKEPPQIYEKHFVDSALPLQLVNVLHGTKIIDVGTGAGFPGVVFEICRPDLDITLLDSLRKRVDYLKLLRERLGLRFAAVHGRGEELSLTAAHRERYDMAVSRAVAGLPALCELCLPFVKVGGTFLAMKGRLEGSGNSELEASANALRLLGGEVEAVKSYSLPSGDERSLVVIRKTKPTPPKFPRRRVNIGKNPL